MRYALWTVIWRIALQERAFRIFNPFFGAQVERQSNFWQFSIMRSAWKSKILFSKRIWSGSAILLKRIFHMTEKEVLLHFVEKVWKLVKEKMTKWIWYTMHLNWQLKLPFSRKLFALTPLLSLFWHTGGHSLQRAGEKFCPYLRLYLNSQTSPKDILQTAFWKMCKGKKSKL